MRPRVFGLQLIIFWSCNSTNLTATDVAASYAAGDCYPQLLNTHTFKNKQLKRLVLLLALFLALCRFSLSFLLCTIWSYSANEQRLHNSFAIRWKMLNHINCGSWKEDFWHFKTPFTPYLKYPSSYLSICATIQMPPESRPGQNPMAFRTYVPIIHNLDFF